MKFSGDILDSACWLVGHAICLDMRYGAINEISFQPHPSYFIVLLLLLSRRSLLFFEVHNSKIKITVTWNANIGYVWLCSQYLHMSIKLVSHVGQGGVQGY